MQDILEKNKLSNLSDYELLKKIFLSDNTIKSIQEKFMPLTNLKNASLNELKSLNGFNNKKAQRMLAALELAKRLYLNKPKRRAKLKTAKDIYEYMRYLYDGLDQEVFYTLYFNSKQELLSIKMLYKGLINRVDAHPREIFKEACILSASRIVCMHNHPSGDSNPSLDDIAFTDTIKRAGELMGINVIDHIIVTDHNYYSFLEHNRVFSFF